MKFTSSKTNFLSLFLNEVNLRTSRWLEVSPCGIINRISRGIEFHILGPEQRIDCAHFDVEEAAWIMFVPLLVDVVEVRVTFLKISVKVRGIDFKACLCITLATSRWWIWLTLSRPLSFITVFTLSRGFRKNIVRRNLLAHAWIFLRIEMWLWCQTTIPFLMWLIMRLWYNCNSEFRSRKRAILRTIAKFFCILLTLSILLSFLNLIIQVFVTSNFF